MAFAARDFEGAIGHVGEKLFHPIGILRVSQAVAEQDHAVFYVSGLPGVQEVIGGGEREYVARVERICLLGRMAARSGPDGIRQKEEIYC